MLFPLILVFWMMARLLTVVGCFLCSDWRLFCRSCLCRCFFVDMSIISYTRWGLLHPTVFAMIVMMLGQMIVWGSFCFVKVI